MGIFSFQSFTLRLACTRRKGLRHLSPRHVLSPMAITMQDFTLNFQFCNSPQLLRLENMNPKNLLSAPLNYFSVLAKRVPPCSRCRCTLYKKRNTEAFSDVACRAAPDGAVPCSPGDPASCWSPQGDTGAPIPLMKSQRDPVIYINKMGFKHLTCKRWNKSTPSLVKNRLLLSL